MAERERRSTPPYGGVFVARSQVMDADDVRRAIWRMAHEIIERNHGLDNVVLVGLQTGGVGMAEAFAEALARDRRHEPARSARSTSPSTATTSASGRCSPRRSPTSRSTSTAPSWCSSTTCSSPAARSGPPSTPSTPTAGPASVQLAVMVDRGHRELPIRPDYVGKNLPTRRDEMVNVSPEGVDLGEVVKS